MMKRIETVIFEGEQEWLNYLCDSFKKIVESSLSNALLCHVALSGGKTPFPFYERLTKEDLPWEKICFWLGDERWVAVNDPQSNEGMILRAFGNISKKFQFHGWHLSEDPQQAAFLYEKLLIEKIGNPPVFDLVLLGIGEDGHTASLFSGSEALEEKNRYVAVTSNPSNGQIRLTFTFPLLNRARQVWFLVAGKKKQKVIENILLSHTDLPAGRLSVKNQWLIWLNKELSF